MERRLAEGARLVLASHNPGKLAEFAELLRPFAVEVVSAGALGLPEPPEDAPDFVGNARIKALAAHKLPISLHWRMILGFCVSALGGAPGVHSARWAGPGKDFAAAMARVRDGMGEAVDWRAWFIAALCLAWPDGTTATFLGRVDGWWFGRRGETEGSAMTRCSRPPAPDGHSARWMRWKNTQSVTARGLWQAFVEACVDRRR